MGAYRLSMTGSRFAMGGVAGAALVFERAAHEFQATRYDGAHSVGGLWPEFGWGGDEPGPQTESAVERGFRGRGPVDEEWGRSDSFDPDNSGDIADEGPGHRG